MYIHCIVVRLLCSVVQNDVALGLLASGLEASDEYCSREAQKGWYTF